MAEETTVSRDETKDDVCVIGGGPAGLTLALLLLRSGFGVTLVERSRSTQRSYRGEILQPGGLSILDDLGVLAGIRERGAYSLAGFRLRAGQRVLLNIDYRRLAPPYNHLLSVPQPHILAELLAHCERHSGFTYLAGFKVRELVETAGQIAGAIVADGEREIVVHARCVVGADGRYSRTRSLAGIGAGRLEVFDQDVLWFKLVAPDRLTNLVQIHRATEGTLIVHDSYPDRLQIGWTLPHRGYAAVAAQGFPHVRDQLTRSLPEYADLITAQLTRLGDLTLLDVFGGCATEWVRDGLVLIGDSAHTHGPLGAQGINLAIQDAALLHRILVPALRNGDLSSATLSEFPRLRRPDVDRVLATQRMQARGMLVHNPVADVIRPIAASLIGRTPIGRKITHRIAVGNPNIRVHTELFTSDPDQEKH